MQGPLKVGVVGTGSLGREHARIYAAMAREGRVDFRGIVDRSADAARLVAEKVGTQVLPDLDALIREVDAVSVVTPTVTHHEIAMRCLRGGLHVLVEKPITVHSEQAAELVALAAEQERVLQVGHIERFNPVYGYMRQAAPDPRFIEVHRLSPFPARSTDIGVVLDLMIHDLDIVLALVQSPVEQVDAAGTPVLSDSEDIANARLRFANGCVANLTASRVSPERLRKIRVFSHGEAPSYLSLDFRAQEGFVYRLAEDGQAPSSFWKMLLAGRDTTIVSEFGGRRIVREPIPLERREPLALELESFVDCARRGIEPVVTGRAAGQALELALEITRQIAASPKASPSKT